MNGFLQEYGLNIVAVIIVLAFIVFASVFGDTITGGINDITSDFFAKSEVTADVGGEDECASGHTDSDADNICDDCKIEIAEDESQEGTTCAKTEGCILEYGHDGHCYILAD